MDEADGEYAPQSPDLSAYNSSSFEPPPQQRQNSYYPPQPYSQNSYNSHATSYNDPYSYGDSTPQPFQTQQYSAMPSNGKPTSQDDDDEWTPANTASKGNRKGKNARAKVEMDYGKPAPGVEEGIEVKTKFPVARIKRIMQADEDVGKVAQVTPTAVSKALELFMISVVTKAANEAKAKSSRRVTAAHLKQAVAKDVQLDFLDEIISKIPDAPAPKKDDDSEGAAESKKKKASTSSGGGTKRRKKWSRLIGGAGTSPNSKQTIRTGPQQRLTSFKLACLQLQQAWQKKAGRIFNSPARGTVSSQLQTINRFLREETHGAAPHLCVEYIATAQVYALVSSIGATSLDEQLQQEAVRFFDLLIDREEEDFIENPDFADKLMAIFRETSDTPKSVSPETEVQMVELLFAITAKLRQRSAVPLAWFRSSEVNSEHPTSSARLLHKSRDFPLVFKLLEHVHHSGKTGDFARTGLLYIFELAAKSPDVEKWIIESELATLMASGLGALYSQLSSKVALSYAPESTPSILTFSNASSFDPPYDAEPVFSTGLQTNLRTFISYLIFWQDILERCSSPDIRATLLDHFDFLFLRPLLYPSLVESSDIDSGSSVAVMTYLRSVFENVSNADIVRLLLRYMLGSPPETVKESKPSRPSTLARRRKSESLVTISATRSDDPTPDLLTLTNIIHGYLLSRNQQTVTASLRLLATILRFWHNLTTTNLLKMQNLGTTDLPRTLEQHERSLDFLYTLAEDILDDDGLKEYYESHLQDAQAMVEMHSCSTARLLQSGLSAVAAETSAMTRNKRLMRTISEDDPLLADLLSLLDDFLVNDIEVNLSLTENLAALASCSDIVLEGWLLQPISVNPGHESTDNEMKNEESSPADVEIPSDFPDRLSPVFDRLSSLVGRLERLRQDIQDFDIYLAERRHIFKVGEEIDDAVADIPKRKSSEMAAGMQTRVHDQMRLGSIAERLKTSSNVSRSSSPRGRPQEHASDLNLPPDSLVGRLSHLRVSPSPSPSKGLKRTFSPSPLRRDSLSSSASNTLPSPRGPPDVINRKVRLKTYTRRRKHLRENTDSEASSVNNDSVNDESEMTGETKEIGLSHLLTNIIILQEFVLELAAIIQVRASLFGESQHYIDT
ncbi:MAG: hypothetical protein Q9212_003610 [Teloschistes hypoglaucus]